MNKITLIASVCSLIGCTKTPAVCQSLPKNDQEIQSTIDAHRPLNGYKIPENVADILGATHMGGKYYLTDEPYLIEGARKLQQMGFRVAKFFISQKGEGAKGYPYNSNWELELNSSFEDMAAHPYFKAALSYDFSTVVLNVTNTYNLFDTDSPDFQRVYRDIYNLSIYLLTEYKNRDITFVIKNWEGDWLLRKNSNQTEEWKKYPDKELRIANMVKWIEVRQKAVTDARKRVKKTNAKLLLAVEVNRVYDSMNGVEGVANSILPKVQIDMVSWSAYDGMKSAVGLYKGIEYLKQQMRPTDYMKDRKAVMLGEIGIQENVQKDHIERRMDEFLGVCFALGVDYFIYWELYCNEPFDQSRRDQFWPVREASQMKGLWLVKPDGELSQSGSYLERVLRNAGGVIQ